MGVFWVAYFVLANAFAGANADPVTSSNTAIVREDGAQGTVLEQSQTYAQEFPETANDYLNVAQHFTIFTNKLTRETNVNGNIAAGTVVSTSGNGGKTPPELIRDLVKDANGVAHDVYYYQNNGASLIPKVDDDESLNPKMVLGSGIQGIHEINNGKPFTVNGGQLQLDNGQLFQENSNTTYINIAADMANLKGISEAVAVDTNQTHLDPIYPKPGTTDTETGTSTDNANTDAPQNLTVFDANNGGGTDKYNDTYENAYALKLTKYALNTTDPLAGAKFTIQYPVYPAQYTGTETPEISSWADLKPGVEVPVTDDDGNPTYDANHKLITQKVKLYDSQHQEITTTGPSTALTVAKDGRYAGLYLLTTDANGQINVAVNVSGNYQFKEVAAPDGYIMPQDVNTDVTTFRTSNTPIAREFDIDYNEIMKGAKLYFVNMDLSKNAAPIEININFSNAPAVCDFDAPDTYFISPENSPANTTEALKNITIVPHIDLSNADVRAANYNKILWNYKGTSAEHGAKITLNNDYFYGTILAPTSELFVKGAHIFGSSIFKSSATMITNS